jgi:hypothetical protein
MSLNFRKKKEDNLKNLELRKQFINFLEKLSDNNTRDIGNKGLKQLIIDNNNSYQALRIFLNSLMNFNTDNIKAKEIIILLYGYIGQIYENNLLDPIDNPPSLVHSINRIVSHIRNKHMKSNNYTILKSCSYSILQILDYCMPKNDIINLNKIFIEPFINDINNAFHIYVKNGCCLYINDLVYHLKKAKDYEIEMLKCILVDNKFISDVILKIKIDFFQNYFLYETVYNMILYFNFEFFRKDSINIIYKMIDILENKILLKKETKISCLKVLYILIQKYSENNYNINNKKEILKDIRDSVGNYIDDRIDEVRKVARDTIKLLNEVEFEEKKFDINNVDKIKHRKIFETMRNYSKKNKIHKFGEYDNMIVDNLQNDIYDKGVSNLINLSNFLKNHTKKNEIEKFDNNKNYLKSNNIKKFNYYNKGPFFNENNYLDNLNKKEHFSKNKNNKNIFLTDDNFIASTNLEDTSKYQSMINDNVQKKENKYINKYNKNSSKPKFDPSIYYSINVNDIYNSINDSKKLFLSFEKNINSKLYENENKLMKIQTSIEKNTNNIIKYHNNILNETIKSNYTQTEKDKNEIENTLLKTSEFNEEGKEYFRIYLKALKLFYKNNFNEAFSLIVDDDIYLLRLLFLAKNKLDIICPLLNKDLYKKMILKINHLCHSHFLIKIQKMLKNSINHKCNNNF